MNEQIGEIRGTINETNRTVGMIEVKATKAADLVESVQPDKLMIEVQKMDGKIEALRGNLEANEEMMRNIMDQLRIMRNQIAVFRGLEQVIKMTEDTKQEVMNMKKISAMVEGHSDKVENIFAEMQKSFKEFNDFVGSIDQLKTNFTDANEKIQKQGIKIETFVDKKDFEKRVAKFEKQDEKVKKLLLSLQSERETFIEQLNKKLYKLEIIAEAYQNLIEDNPVFTNELNLSHYVGRYVTDKAAGATQEVAEMEKQAEGEASSGGEGKDGEKKEGEVKDGEKKEGTDSKDSKEPEKK